MIYAVVMFAVSLLAFIGLQLLYFIWHSREKTARMLNIWAVVAFIFGAAAAYIVCHDPMTKLLAEFLAVMVGSVGLYWQDRRLGRRPGAAKDGNLWLA